jgi:hypothetical protein
MLRSDFVMKLMSAVLFVAIAAYIGLYIFKAADKQLATTPAIRYTLEESGSAEGYIVREETLLAGTPDTVTLLTAEGKKVGAGQTIAVYYEGETALARASEIRALQLEIKEAESELESTAAVRTLDTNACILALSDAVSHRSFSDLQDLTFSVRYRVFTGKSEKVTDTDLSVLKGRLTQLLEENAGVKTVYSPMSGIFSSVVDGYEALKPDALTDMTPSSLKALFSGAQPEKNVLGKLITGIKWYYAAVMNADDADKLSGKDIAVMQFTKTFNEKLEMKVESIGAEENGKVVVVFSSRQGISDIAALRTLTAEVAFDSMSGLLVPKEAVHTEPDGKTYIYLLTVLQAEKVYVEIISQDGSDYIVKDGAVNGTVLREGSEIIVKGNDLYDGKVVDR